MSSKCYDYLAHIGEILEKVKTTQWDSIEKSAKKIAETIAAGHSVYIFGASHAGILSQEMFYRTGGLAVVNAILPSEFMLNTRPVTQTSAMERLEGYPTVILNNSDVEKEICFCCILSLDEIQQLLRWRSRHQRWESIPQQLPIWSTVHRLPAVILVGKSCMRCAMW